MNIKKILSVGFSLVLVLGFAIGFSNMPVVKADSVYGIPPESPSTANVVDPSAKTANVLEAFIQTPGVTFADPGFVNMNTGWTATTISPTYAAEYSATSSSLIAEDLNIANGSSSVVVNIYVFAGCNTQPASACPSLDLVDAYQVTFTNGGSPTWTTNLSSTTLASENTATPANLILTVPTTATITQSSALIPETNGVPTSNAAVTTAVARITPIPVTLANTGGTVSGDVRIAPVDASSHVQLWAKDSSNNWYDINVTGWGPSGGFSVPANSSATTNVYAISNIAGSYPLTTNLVDAANSSTIITSGSGTLVVNAAPSATFTITPSSTPAYAGVQTSFNVGVSGVTLPGDTSDQITLSFRVTNASGTPVSGQTFSLSSIAGVSASELSGLGVTLATSTDANGTISVTGSINDLAQMLDTSTSTLTEYVPNTIGTVLTTFAKAGTYTLSLTASDVNGTIASTTAKVVVNTPSPSSVYVHIAKYLDGVQATSANASGTSFPMVSTWTAANLNGGVQASGSYSLGTGDSYQVVTSPMTSGADYTTHEVTTGEIVGASCSAGDPFALAGYSTGASIAAAASSSISATIPNFTSLTGDEYVIVWNKDCLSAPTLLSPSNGTVTSTAGLTSVVWNPVTDPAGGITYVYQSSNSSSTNPDGSFVTPAYTSGSLATTTILTTGTSAGVYYWHVKAIDVDGNVSPWSTAWTFTVDNTPASVSYVTTDAASGMTSTDATLNGVNGADSATGHSFWVSTSTFSTASPNIPSGVYSTPNFGSINASTTFSASLSSITTTGIPGNLPAVTPGTTYYYAAWSLVNGVWHPGAIMSFTTPAEYVVTDAATGVATSSATVNGTNGSFAADNTSFWWGTTPITGTLASGVNPGGSSEFPSTGWTHDGGLGSASTTGSFNETLTGLTPSTTYYYVAWSYVGGIWYPGTVKSFATSHVPYVTTDAASGMTSTDATLNGVNGADSATGHSFWVSTSTFSTASPNIPSGVYSTPNFGSINASTTFSASLSSITTTGIPGNLPAVTPGTTYYYAAWSLVNGVWHPGAIMSFTTPAEYVVTDAATGVATSSATVNGTNGSFAADNTSFWWGTTSAGPLIASADPAGVNNHATDELPSGWHDGVFPGQRTSGASFSYSLTGLTPGTTYYYVAWSQMNGIWHPGAIMSFTTPALGADDTLSALGVSAGVLLPTFNSSTTSYTDMLPYDTTIAPTVMATTTDPNATDTITQAMSTTGSATVAVTAQNGSATQNYTVNFSLAPASTSILNVAVVVDGGNATSSDFKVDLIASGASTSSFLGSAAGTEVTINPNTSYHVNILTLKSYTPTLDASGSCNSESGLPAGSAAVCTITETYNTSDTYNLTPLFSVIVGGGPSGGDGGGKVLGASISGIGALQEQIAVLQAKLLALLQQYLAILQSRGSH